MKLSKILVLVMTFAMLISAFAPTLGVFAEGLNNDDQIGGNEDKTLNYVSIGDSMANGYGFDGYKQWEEGHDFANGIGTYGKGAYPLQFEEYLKEQGYDVNHTKLALSAMTPEFLLYLLGGRDAYDNPWHEGVLDYAGDDDTPADVEWMKEHYQNAVAGADVITLGVGNGNLGAFLLSEITSAIGIMGGSPNPNPNYTLENALAVVEDEKEKELVLNVYNSVMEDLKPQLDMIGEEYGLGTIEQIADIFAYSVAGIIFNYSRILDKIDELNEKDDLDIIIVALMNTTYGMKVELENGEIFDFGGLMDEVFGLVNSYLSMYPAAMKTMGEYESINFTYAKQPQPKFILQAFDELQAAGWTNVDCGNCGTDDCTCADGEGRLSADIVRARTIKSYNSSLREMIAGAMGLNLPEITLDDVKAWKEWGPEIKEIIAQVYGVSAEYITDDYMGAAFPFMRPDILQSQGQDASIGMTTSVAIYLAIEDAIVKSINEKTIKVNDLLKIANIDQLMTVFDGIDTTESDKSPYHVRQIIGNHLSQDSIIPLVNIYAIFQIGDGMCVHPTPAGHDDIAAEIISAYESGKSIDKDDVLKIYDYLREYYDEIYAYAYEYIDAEGYIQPYADAIQNALDNLAAARAEVDALVVGEYGLTAELKGKALAELDAAIATLEEIKLAIDSDKIGTIDGLGDAILGLQDDLYTHIGNVVAILEQVNNDVVAIVVPMLNEAQRIFNDEILPAFFVMAEEFAYVAVDYVLTNLDVIYYNFPEIVNTAYAEALKVLVMAQIIIGDVVDVASDIIVEAYARAYELGVQIFDKSVDACIFAYELIETVLGTLIAINDNTDGLLEDVFADTFGVTVEECLLFVVELQEQAQLDAEQAWAELQIALEYVKENVKAELPKAIALYRSILSVLNDAYGYTSDALVVAGQIFSYVYDFAVDNDIAGNLKGHLDNIVELIAETYRGTKDIEKVGAEIYAYAIAIFDDTFAADYELTVDSLYVALGNATYGEELAEMLHLGDKYYNFGLDEDYLGTLADADFVTIRIDNGEMIEFAMNQVVNYGTELDWNAYLDAEGQAALDRLLAGIENALLNTGAANEMAIFVENIIIDQFGGYELEITLEDELVASVLTYSLESLIYAYADTIGRLETTLDNVYTVAPDATVVITGAQNPLEGLDLAEMGLDLSEYNDEIKAVINIFNAQLVAVAYANESTIYVDSVDALDIYSALTVTCKHSYTDCADTTCDICGAERVAPGHKYGDWKVVKEATVDEEGREERTCEVCGHVDARSIAKLTPEPAPAPAPTPEGPKNNPTPIIIAACIAVAAIAGFVVWKRKQTPTPDAPIDEEAPVEEAPVDEGTPADEEAPNEEE